MTKEEAKKRIKKLLRWYLKEEPMSETMYMREAVNMATEALSAEPQGDLISREAVLEIVNSIKDCISIDGYWAILERVKALPPVEQTEWISVKEAYTKGEWLFEPTQNINNPWKCSCCGHRAGRYKYNTYKFCPWCGAKMDKGEEETQRPYKEYQDLRTGEYVREYKGEE